MKKNKDYLFSAFWVLLFAVGIAYAGSSVLSDYQPIPGVEIRVFNPVSELSDVLIQKDPERVPEAESLVAQEIPPTAESETLPEEPLYEEPKTPETIDIPETVPGEARSSISGGLTDYDPAQGALAQIRNGLSSGRYIIGVLGDSFIEGDIFVGALRNALQSRYGGKGVGYVGITSPTARFRQTIKHRFSGAWANHNSNKAVKGDRFTLSEQFDIPKGAAEAVFSMSPTTPTLASADRATLYYETDSLLPILYSINGGDEDTLLLQGVGGVLQHYVFESQGMKALTIKVPDQGGAASRLHGIYFDGSSGISVDNYSLRGASGLHLSRLSTSLSRQIQASRPHDLLILIYGLNVVSPNTDDDYKWYYHGMDKAVAHLKELYPNTKIIIFSVSDRATIVDGDVKTLKGISYVLKHQAAIAKKHGCLFWNTYDAMQALGGIESFVEKGWAAKDYTHLSTAGGNRLANAFLKDLLGEE